MGMVHIGLLPYYERLFSMAQYHNWSITEMEDMYPWELDVYVTLLANYIDTVETNRKNKEFGGS